MDNLMQGVINYRKTHKATLLKEFKRVKDNPHPKVIFFSCIDSRLFPPQFTSAHVGDMFVVRAAGNLIPCCTDCCGDHNIHWESTSTDPAALELACIHNNVPDVVVCGHSDCKAMNLLYSFRNETKIDENAMPLERWVRRYGATSLAKFKMHENDPNTKIFFQAETKEKTFHAVIDPERRLHPEDRLSQINCLQQLQHVASYPFLKSRLEEDRIRLHAMWFDIYTGDVHLFSRCQQRFVMIDEENFEHLEEDSCNAPFFHK